MNWLNLHLLNDRGAEDQQTSINKCTLELRNDTLYQTNRTIDASGKETGYTVEKYVKADK